MKRLVGSSLHIARCASVLMVLFSLSMPQAGAVTPRERKFQSAASASTGDRSFDASEAKRNQSTGSWSADDLIEPADLARLLSSDQKPVVLQIGVVHLYKLAHIPGSKFAGAASDTEGIALLKKEAEGLPRSKEIVCYCGCCPWDQCPNIRPAYKALREMGFTKIKMLHLPNTFTQDWAMKNFPVEKGA